MALDNAPTNEPALRVLVVQTDLPMSNKLDWSREEKVEDFLEFAKLTLEGARAAKAAGTPADVAAWPETTLPGLGLERESIQTMLEQQLDTRRCLAIVTARLQRYINRRAFE